MRILIRYRLIQTVLILIFAGQLVAQTPSSPADSYYHFSLAKYYDVQEKYPLAIEQFEKALALDPQSARLHFEFARTLLKAREIRRAVEEAEKSVELDPEQPEPHLLLGQVYKGFVEGGQSNMLEKAMAAFGKVVELDPDQPEALFYLGQLQLMKGDPASAEVTFGRFTDVRPTITKGFNYRAQALISLNRYDEALAVLEDSLRYRPDDVENLELLGRLYEERQEFDKALAIYEQASRYAPSAELAFRRAQLLGVLGRGDESIGLLRQMVKDDPDDLNSRVELGKALEGARRFAEALEIFEGVLKSEPNHTEATYYLSSTLRALGRRAEAIEKMKHLLVLTQSSGGTYPPQLQQYRNRFKSFLAVLYQEDDQFDEAIAIFRELIREQPEDFRPQLGLVYALQDAGRLDEALESSGRLVEKFSDGPERRDVIITHARGLALSGKLEEAASLLMNEKDGSEADKDLYLAVGQLFAEARKYSQAEMILSQGLEEFPDDPIVLFQLAAMRERQDNHEGSEAIFRDLIAKDPNNAAALNYLGYMLADRGVRLEESLGYIERAVELEPDSGAYLDSLGWVLFRLGRLQEAQEHLERAVAISGTDSTILAHLAELLEQKGEVRRALELYEKSVTLAEDPEEKERVSEKLESLRKRLRRN